MAPQPQARATAPLLASLRGAARTTRPDPAALPPPETCACLPNSGASPPLRKSRTTTTRPSLPRRPSRSRSRRAGETTGSASGCCCLRSSPSGRRASAPRRHTCLELGRPWLSLLLSPSLTLSGSLPPSLLHTRHLQVYTLSKMGTYSAHIIEGRDRHEELQRSLADAHATISRVANDSRACGDEQRGRPLMAYAPLLTRDRGANYVLPPTLPALLLLSHPAPYSHTVAMRAPCAQIGRLSSRRPSETASDSRCVWRCDRATHAYSQRLANPD